MSQDLPFDDPLELARIRLDTALSHLADGSEGLKRKTKHANNKVSALQEEVSLLQAGIEKLAKEKDSLDQSNIDLDKQYKDVRGALERVEVENLRLHEKIAQMTLEDRRENSHDIEALKADKDTLERNYTLLKRQFQQLQSETKNNQETDSKKQQELDEKDALIATLKDALSASEKERDMRNQENETLQMKITKTEQENSHLRKDRESIKDRLDTAIKQVTLLIEGSE